MPILTTELLWYKAAEMSDAATNGGRMSANLATSGVKNAKWPDVPESERVAGSTKYRKTFIKVANDADLTLISPRVFIENITSADDRVVFFPGTQTDQQSAISGSERIYGAGTLDSGISGGATSIPVLQEAGADVIFVQGDTIRISDKTSILDAGNNEEFLVIATGGVSAPVGDVVTLTTTTGTANAYSGGAGTRISSVYEPADVVSSFSSFVVNSAAGTYTTASNLIVDNIGGVQQNWTLTFTSSTAFDLTGNTLGAVGSGTTASTFAPNNPDFTKPYFSMNSAGWGGSFIAADTVTFTTAPASIPVWEKRIVPAGSTSLSNNNFVIAIDGESS